MIRKYFINKNLRKKHISHCTLLISQQKMRTDVYKNKNKKKENEKRKETGQKIRKTNKMNSNRKKNREMKQR